MNNETTARIITEKVCDEFLNFARMPKGKLAIGIYSAVLETLNTFDKTFIKYTGKKICDLCPIINVADKKLSPLTRFRLLFRNKIKRAERSGPKEEIVFVYKELNGKIYWVDMYRTMDIGGKKVLI